jgi:hypothetical protein
MRAAERWSVRALWYGDTDVAHSRRGGLYES